MGVFYLIAVAGLMVWEFRDHLGILSTHCEAADSEPQSATFSEPYKHLLNWTRRPRSTEVSVIAIPADLADIQGNLCEARAYMADLLDSIAAQHPAEVVIDKFYGPTSCTSSPEATRAFVAAVQTFPAPVVLGESTAKAEKEVDGACLVRKPQLDFASPNVRHGLTRINFETEKVPLQWSVLPAGDPTPTTKSQAADGLAWTAVKTFAERPRIQELIDSGRHPYANLDITLPRQTSTNLLCVAGSAEIQKRWAVTCTGPIERLPLTGKIVLIGSEDEIDRREVLGSPMYGFDMQARYIQVLLSGSYLRALPFSAGLLTFALFIFIIEGVPTLLEAFRPGWRNIRFVSRAFPRRRYAWVVFWAIATVILTSLVCLALGYLPPLIVFGDIWLVAITRLLLFAAETTETKFHHSSPKEGSSMIPERTPLMPEPDVKIDKPGGEGGTAGIAAEASEFVAPQNVHVSANVKIDRPGGEGGTAG
jgi:hypothetical protein